MPGGSKRAMRRRILSRSPLSLLLALLLSRTAKSWALIVLVPRRGFASSSTLHIVGPATATPWTARVFAAAASERSAIPTMKKRESKSGIVFLLSSLATAGEQAESTMEEEREGATKLSPESMQRRLELLDESLLRFNSASANQLLKELSELRSSSSGTTGGSAGGASSVVDAVLDRLLAQGPDRTLPTTTTTTSLGASRPSVGVRVVKTAVRRAVASVLPVRWSRRARFESLRRTLDCATPPPNEDSDDDASNDATRTEQRDRSADEQRRRRRALVSLLRTLARPVDTEEDDQDDNDESLSDRGGVAIRYLEKKAVREAKSRSSDADLTTRRPKGLETPNYRVVEVVSPRKRKYGKVEIRSYDPYSVCTVSMDKPRPINSTATDAQVTDSTTGGARAFGALAGYLFGKNQQQQAMAMTTPVISKPQRRRKSPSSMQAQASGLVEDGKVMSFVMPSQYWDREALKAAPQPLDGSGVTLEYVEGGCRAVLLFGGYASKGETDQRKEALRLAVDRSEGWDLVPDEPISLAQYNDPFTPPWKRVNEVSVPVRPASKEE